MKTANRLTKTNVLTLSHVCVFRDEAALATATIITVQLDTAQNSPL